MVDSAPLHALFVNATLTRSPGRSHTQALMDRSIALLRDAGVDCSTLRLVDFPVADGVQPDMREHGAEVDAWPDEVWPRVRDADILVVGTPIWLGEPSSVARRFVDRLYAMSDETNDRGQPIYSGKVAATVTTGNEDGVKNSGKHLLYALQHIGYTIPPAAETGWIGPIGPGPSYADPGSGGPKSEYTTRTLRTMTANLYAVARLLRDAGGIPALGDDAGSWEGDYREAIGAGNPE